jgi:hypothetical protein
LPGSQRLNLQGENHEKDNAFSGRPAAGPKHGTNDNRDGY